MFIYSLRFRAKGVKKHTLDTADTAGQVCLHATPIRNNHVGRAHFNPTCSCRSTVFRHWASHFQVRHKCLPIRCYSGGPQKSPQVHTDFVALLGGFVGVGRRAHLARSWASRVAGSTDVRLRRPFGHGRRRGVFGANPRAEVGLDKDETEYSK